jgi:osmotically-inducible protein OsmY
MRASLRSAAGLAAALVVSTLTLPALAGPTADGTPRTDAEIALDVRRAILAYPQTTVFDDFAFKVEQGQVTLLGSVQRPYRSTDVARRVAKIPGVQSVDNRIEVQPPSSFDDEVRLALVKAIYRVDRFPNYGLGANPSVRILVARGRVTLSGVVASRVDQVQLGMIARSIAPFGVTNRLQVESEIDKEAQVARPGLSI